MAWQAGLTDGCDDAVCDANGNWVDDFFYSSSQEEFYSQQAEPDTKKPAIAFVKAGTAKVIDESDTKKPAEVTATKKDEKEAAAKTADEENTSKKEVTERK